MTYRMPLSHAQAIVNSEAAVTNGVPMWKLRAAVEVIETSALASWQDAVSAEYIRSNILPRR